MRVFSICVPFFSSDMKSVRQMQMCARVQNLNLMVPPGHTICHRIVPKAPGGPERDTPRIPRTPPRDSTPERASHPFFFYFYVVSCKHR